MYGKVGTGRDRKVGKKKKGVSAGILKRIWWMVRKERLQEKGTSVSRENTSSRNKSEVVKEGVHSDSVPEEKKYDTKSSAVDHIIGDPRELKRCINHRTGRLANGVPGALPGGGIAEANRGVFV